MDVSMEVDFIRKHARPGLRLAFSGGKDSIVCKRLLQLAGVKFEAFYCNTTIDMPELVRYMKKYHPDVKWRNPKIPMLTKVAETYNGPPSERRRWCCKIYKEQRRTDDDLLIVGIRAEESPKRAARYKSQVAKMRYGRALLPILRWREEEVWQFIEDEKLPYCELYDEGFSRLGCVGCPIIRAARLAQFRRWPRFARLWERAVKRNWEKWHNVPRRDGKPRYHARFKSAEEFWQNYIDIKPRAKQAIEAMPLFDAEAERGE